MSLEVGFQPMPKRFKVWDTKENKFLDKQNWAILSTQPDCGVTLPYENTHNPENIDEDCIDWADADLLTGRYLICQSANLFDKDGKEIFEGSIIEVNGVKFIVVHNKRCWEAKSITCSISFGLDEVERAYNGAIKVIDHILSSPELVEE